MGNVGRYMLPGTKGGVTMRGYGMGRGAGFGRGNPYPFCRCNPALPARRVGDKSEAEYLKSTAAYLKDQL